MKNYPSICIIGAGISGITMIKALGERGVQILSPETVGRATP